MTTVQYIQRPPDLPPFLASRASSLRDLIQWAKSEHQRWIMRCSEHGYYRYLKVLNEEYSPMRFLAEMPEFRRICANIKEYEWNQLSGRERVFIRRAFELQGLLSR